MSDYQLAVVDADEEMPTAVVADYHQRSGNELAGELFHAWHLPVVTRFVLEDDGKPRGFLLSRQSHLNPEAQEIVFYHALSEDDVGVLLGTVARHLQSRYRAIACQFVPVNPYWPAFHLKGFTRSNDLHLEREFGVEQIVLTSELSNYSIAPLQSSYVDQLLPIFTAALQADLSYHIARPNTQLIRTNLTSYTSRDDELAQASNHVLLHNGQPVGFSVVEEGRQGCYLRHCIVSTEHHLATPMLLAFTLTGARTYCHHMTTDVAANDLSSQTLLKSLTALGFHIEGRYESYYWWRDDD